MEKKKTTHTHTAIQGGKRRALWLCFATRMKSWGSSIRRFTTYSERIYPGLSLNHILGMHPWRAVCVCFFFLFACGVSKWLTVLAKLLTLLFQNLTVNYNSTIFIQLHADASLEPELKQYGHRLFQR